MTVIKEELSSEDWATINDGLAEAYEEFEKYGRDDMLQLCSDSFDQIEANPEYGVIFTNRLRGRSRMHPNPMPINRVWYNDTAGQYMVMNYDYKMFVWAMKKGFGDTIDNLCISIDESKLTPDELNRFKAKAK